MGPRAVNGKNLLRGTLVSSEDECDECHECHEFHEFHELKEWKEWNE